jgi:hypothetical protein
MTSVHERLTLGAELLTLIDHRRAETENPGIGLCIEHHILERELAELEAEILANPGPLALLCRAEPQVPSRNRNTL